MIATLVLTVLSLAALVVCLLKGKFPLVAAAIALYVFATLAIISGQADGDAGPIVLPTIMVYVVLMFGAMGGAKPGSWWARTRGA